MIVRIFPSPLGLESWTDLPPLTDLSRTVFNADELATLKKRFTELDADNDGEISPDDLRKTMTRFGFKTNDKTVRDILREVDADQNGSLGLEEFLDVAAGLKQLQISNAFTDIAMPKDDKKGHKMDYTSKTPPEKSGGSW